jgi:hypothetical protein
MSISLPNGFIIIAQKLNAVQVHMTGVINPIALSCGVTGKNLTGFSPYSQVESQPKV